MQNHICSTGGESNMKGDKVKFKSYLFKVVSAVIDSIDIKKPET